MQARDDAEEYILRYLDNEPSFNKSTLHTDSKILILNDGFGALTTALSASFPSHIAGNVTGNTITAVSDSYISLQGIKQNLRDNSINPDEVKYLNSLQSIDHSADLIIIKIPKSLAMLEDQLHRIKPSIHKNTRILAAGMTRHIHNSTLQLFEKIIGPCQTSLAQKKSRLIHCQPNWPIQPCNSPYPSFYTLPENDYKICNHANVFSREHLDIGTRFMLQNMPRKSISGTVIDLGCGNGILGLMLASQHPDAEMVFTDESYMAIESARWTYNEAFKNNREARFTVADMLNDETKNSAELILCNPPFHQQNAVSARVAIDMFKSAHQVLKPDGELWIIANRHLAYVAQLKRYFKHVQQIAANKKFVVIRARK